MNLELKKIKWSKLHSDIEIKYRHNYRPGMIFLLGSFEPLNNSFLTFKIRNYKIKYNKLYFDPNIFYLIKYNKIETFNTLEEAKEAAQNECLKFIIRNFFESPPTRKVIIEKSNSKTPLRKIRKKPITAPAEIIDMTGRDTPKKDLPKWTKIIDYDYAYLSGEQLPF